MTSRRRLIATIVAAGLWVYPGKPLPARQQPSVGSQRNAAATAPSSIEGDWTGTLSVGDVQLHLVLHLSKDKKGQWHVSVDSLNQAVYGMEASKVTRTGESLQFELASVGAQFHGKLLPGHQMIRGVWEQGGTGLPLRLERRRPGAINRSAVTVSSVEGTWQGAIVTGNMRMRLQLHVSHDDQGKLVAALDSIDQGIQGIPASQVTEKGGDLKFEISAFNAEYTGTLNAAKNQIAGDWRQNENLVKLDFERSDQVLALRRPQNPTKPYPYQEEVVTFAGGDPTVLLSGTLTLPPGSGPFPAALLVAGSTSNDRDGTIAGHKPFLVLADLLTRNGFAVLRYDKRGNGQSTGDYAAARLSELGQDAQAAVKYLKSRKEADGKRLGIIAHGEGGIFASMVAAQDPDDIRWLVLLAMPATTGERALLRQSELVARTGGLPEAQITKSLSFDRQSYALVRQEKDSATLEKKLSTLVRQEGLSAAMPPEVLQGQIRQMTTPLFRESLDYDPRPVLQKINCPVLALGGERDLQVDSDENVPLLRQAYEASGNQDFTVVEVAGVNHLMQAAQSGSPALYGAIEETVAPEVLTAVISWTGKHTVP